MDKTFIFGLGITLISIVFPYEVKTIPNKIGWTGIIIGLILILASALYWIHEKWCLKQQKSLANLSASEKLSVVLIPMENQLNLHNQGKQEVYLWGTKFADTPKNIDKEPRTIPTGHFYYFLTDKLKTQAHLIIGPEGEQLVPFEVYLTDSINSPYIAKFLLLIQIKNGVVAVHTQQLGICQEKFI